jgi:predicted flap endonuclease-1-like 5' DNA nuclease
MSHHSTIGSAGTPLSGLALAVWLMSDQQRRPAILWVFLVLLVIIIAVAFIWTQWEERKKAEGILERPRADGAGVAPAAPATPNAPGAPAPGAVKVPGRVESIPSPQPLPRDPGRAAPSSIKPDDLKIIEGIGPKIAALLQSQGIRTFRDLADADVERLHQILADARLSALADPASWPRQAWLAAEGDWDGLQSMQDQLKGGREA